LEWGEKHITIDERGTERNIEVARENVEWISWEIHTYSRFYVDLFQRVN
jgi:hypothetical protein